MEDKVKSEDKMQASVEKQHCTEPAHDFHQDGNKQVCKHCGLSV